MSITHRAMAESEHFSYEAFGSSETSARAALLAGLVEHAGQMGTAATWPEEMLAEARVVSIGAGGSQFTTFDLAVVGREVIAPRTGEITCRAIVETADVTGAWGHLDAYGASEGEVRELLRRALGVHIAHRSDADEYGSRILEGTFVYQIEEDASYRGGLVGPAGERLA